MILLTFVASVLGGVLQVNKLFFIQYSQIILF